MNHVEILKRAFSLTWRYRPLWVFGFFLALCSGGSGGSGGGSPPSPGGSGGDFGDLPMASPEFDPTLLIWLGVGIICLVLLLSALGFVVRAVTRTALIGMVRQISESEMTSVSDGWRVGWSSRAWRLFLVGVVIGIPLFIVSVALILLAASPLLLFFSENTALWVVAIALTILAFLFVFLILLAISVIVTPLLELTWRRAVLDGQGVIDSIGDTFTLIKQNFKDVAIIWLIMLGVGIAWAFIALVVVLPLSIIAAVVVGGLPAAAVYLISDSVIGAAIAGVPLGFLALILVISFLAGLYHIFQSAVWTLAYLDLQAPKTEPELAETAGDDDDSPSLDLSSSPQPAA